MKTVEELAQEYCNGLLVMQYPTDIAANGFIAGYNKAKEWISLEDELPEKEGEYLCRWLATNPEYTETKICSFVYYDTSCSWVDKDGDCDENITHWRYID